MASEKQRMLRGELYRAGQDDELISEIIRARGLIQRLNETPSYTPEALALTKELLGSVGDEVAIEPPFRCDYGYNIHLGDRVFMNYNCVLLDVNEIRIGSRTLLGPGVQIYTSSHPLDPKTRAQSFVFGKPVTIGEDVWIGGTAIILPGVTIGDRAVIGAGSVVTKNVPAGTVYAGNPARFVKNVEEQNETQ